LLISIEFGDTTDYAMKVVGTRLVVVSRHDEESPLGVWQGRQQHHRRDADAVPVAPAF
jgi:hypothetical protein